MTEKEKKSKIADILMDFQEEYSNEVINRPMLASIYAGNILSFIDSLQEEPVSEDLEKAARNHAYSCHTDKASGERIAACIYDFKAGAQWQKLKTKKEVIDNAVEWIVIENKNGGCVYDGWEEDFRKALEKNLSYEQRERKRI